jgi:hypothetical protein
VKSCWAEARVEPAAEIPSADRIASWAAGLLGPLDGPLENISGGAWRSRAFAGQADWPAVNPNQERLKFLASTGGDTWLIKFAGLGDEGERKLRRGRVLAAAGLVPEIRGLIHGFLVERWVDAQPLSAPAEAVPFVARYLSARARLLAPAGAGASLEALFEMAEYNLGRELGIKGAQGLERPAPDLQGQVRPMAVDGRCDAHEWLQLPGGRFLKADALDHDAAHDLIGAQDLAWDAAGAIVELDLDVDQAARLPALLDRLAPHPISRPLLEFLMPCYIAFRLGAARLAEASLGHWPEEAARNGAAAERYVARLRRLRREE